MEPDDQLSIRGRDDGGDCKRARRERRKGLRWILERGYTIAVGTGSEPAKVQRDTKENLDLFSFALSPEERGAPDRPDRT